MVSGASNTVVATVAVGSQPSGAAYDSANGDIYVINELSGNVSVVSGASNTVVATVAVGTEPEGAAYDNANGDIYVSNLISNNVSVVSGASNTVVATVAVGSQPWGAAYDSANGDIYVSNAASNNVSVVSGASNTVVATVAVGVEPRGAVYDSVNRDIYVTNDGSNNVSVVSGTGNTVVATIAVGSIPWGAAYDSANADIYITNNHGLSNVSVVSGASNTVVATVAVGTEPEGAAYDRANGDIYITDAGSGALSIICPSTLISPPTISSFTATPSPTSVGQTTNLTVIASGGSGTLSYTYTGLPLGCTSANTASLTCKPNTAGSYTMRVYVNDTAGKSANASTSLVVTPALASVAVSPSFDYLQVGTSAVFTATPTCNRGTCPSGATYTWTLTNNVLGSLSSSTSDPTTFTADSTVGTDTLFVNATLNGETKEATASITIRSIPVPTLASVSINPSSPSVTAGTTRTFAAAPTCNGGTCPSGTTYAWTLSNSMGTLNSATGSSTVFTAGSKTGTVTLTVEAALNGKVAWSNATLTIVASSSNSSGNFGLPGYEGLIVIGVIMVVAALVIMLLLRKRRGAQSTASPDSGHPIDGQLPPPAGPPP